MHEFLDRSGRWAAAAENIETVVVAYAPVLIDHGTIGLDAASHL